MKLLRPDRKFTPFEQGFLALLAVNFFLLYLVTHFLPVTMDPALMCPIVNGIWVISIGAGAAVYFWNRSQK